MCKNVIIIMETENIGLNLRTFGSLSVVIRKITFLQNSEMVSIVVLEDFETVEETKRWDNF